MIFSITLIFHYGFFTPYLTEAGRIQVYVRVRPFTDKEKEKKEPNAIALHHDHSLVSKSLYFTCFEGN